MEEKSAEVVPVVEDSGSRVVGRYTVEERKDRILRYLKKRNQRNFNKTIKVVFMINYIVPIVIRTQPDCRLNLVSRLNWRDG